MENLSDTQIRANLRTVMNHHKVDLTKTSFVCTRGIVRMVGELARQQAYGTLPLHANDVELLERDLSCQRGVVRVHMEFKNWLRESSGEWKERDAKRRAAEEEEDLPSVEETLQSLSETRLVPIEAYFASKRRRERLQEEAEEKETPRKQARIPRRPA